MNILICGANGFIGRALAEHLRRAGHAVIRGVRCPTRPDDRAMDFSTDLDPGDWRDRLHGVDVVINAVGILTESRERGFETIHHRAPVALFEACASAQVKRVVHISALGVERGNIAYFRTKAAAETDLMRLSLPWQIVRPALIYGPEGTSAGFFRLLASLPVTPLPGGGRQMLQPIHIDDLCRSVEQLIAPDTPAGQVVELAGPTPITLREMLAAYRQQMGFAPAPGVPIPNRAMALGAQVAAHLPGALLTPDTWRMLQQGNTTDDNAAPRLLGHAPRPATRFIPRATAAGTRAAALSAWRTPMLRAALAFVWLFTAFVSAFMFPVESSHALLAPLGLTGMSASVALYGAIAIDGALGVATLCCPGRRLWAAQIGVIALYSAIIAAVLPQFLWHPFGPLSKNIPMLALLVCLIAEEKRP